MTAFSALSLILLRASIALRNVLHGRPRIRGVFQPEASSQSTWGQDPIEKAIACHASGSACLELIKIRPMESEHPAVADALVHTGPDLAAASNHPAMAEGVVLR